MGEVGEIPQEVSNSVPATDRPAATEVENTKVDLLTDVLALPQRVVDHIRNLKDPYGEPRKARSTLAALVGEIHESARSEKQGSGTKHELALRAMNGKLSVTRDKNDSDAVHEIMQVDNSLVPDIQRAAFTGETITNAMRNVNVEFPSPLQHRVNKKGGLGTMIKLVNNNGQVIEKVPLGDRLQVIMDAEAAR